MKWICYLLAGLCSGFYSHAQKQEFVSSDIDNFWRAYDEIVKTKDSIQQVAILQTAYLDKASPGLKSLMEVRNYTAPEIVSGIKSFPEYWSSIRPNTKNIAKQFPLIEKDIGKLRTVYPGLKPSTIYFAVGAFRTNGTIEGKKVLIGAELALADPTTFVNEMPDWRQNFYSSANHLENLPLLCTHEYVHTQQQPLVQNLLSMCLYEGVAEFVSCLATGKKSSTPGVAFGKDNQQLVINKFVEDLYTMSNNYNWVWGENRNELKYRDLGYYVGYEICERYYNMSVDKPKAIRELIELDYTNEREVERIVNMTGVLPKPLSTLYEDYEKSRPLVLSVTGIVNGSKEVSPGLTKITITFSEPLNGHHTGIDFGPLGEAHCPRISRDRSWSADGKSWTFEADLKANQHYQVLISNNFRKSNGVRLKPFLIDFHTANK